MSRTVPNPLCRSRLGLLLLFFARARVAKFDENSTLVTGYGSPSSCLFHNRRPCYRNNLSFHFNHFRSKSSKSDASKAAHTIIKNINRQTAVIRMDMPMVANDTSSRMIARIKNISLLSVLLFIFAIQFLQVSHLC